MLPSQSSPRRLPTRPYQALGATLYNRDLLTAASFADPALAAQAAAALNFTHGWSSAELNEFQGGLGEFERDLLAHCADTVEAVSAD